MDYKIGDRVRVKPYTALNEEDKTKSVGDLFGKEGVIIDKLVSQKMGGYVYEIHFDGYGIPSRKKFRSDMIEMVGAVTYSFSVECFENLVLVRMIENKDERQTEIGRAHGHVIHEGAFGFAQAASFAMHRLCKNMNASFFEKNSEEK